MSIPDRELPETLDLIAKLVASVSTRLDTHGEALDRLTKAQAQAQAAASPDRVAQATATAVQGALVPHLHKIVDVMQELNGTKAILRERLLSSDIRNWPGGDMKNWPTVRLMRLQVRASQRAFAEARCDAFRGAGSCRPGW